MHLPAQGGGRRGDAELPDHLHVRREDRRHPLDECRPPLGHLSDHKERALGTVSGEDVEEARRVLRVRAVIERQADCLPDAGPRTMNRLRGSTAAMPARTSCLIGFAIVRTPTTDRPPPN